MYDTSEGVTELVDSTLGCRLYCSRINRWYNTPLVQS